MMYENPDARDTPGLEDYLSAIRSRWLMVVLITAAVAALGYLYVQTRTVTVEARAEVLVNPAPIGRTDPNRLPDVVLERERGVMNSVRVAELAAVELGSGQSAAGVQRDVDVEFEPDSDILAVLVKRTDAELARDTANELARAYVTLRNQDADAIDAEVLESLDAEIALLEERGTEIQDERELLNRQATTGDTFNQSLNQQVSALNTDFNQVQIELRNIRAERSQAFREQQTRGDAAEVLQLEDIPDFAGIGDRTIYLGALLAGLVAAISLAWLLDRLDRTARETDDVELAVGSKVLGSIPDFGLGNRSGSSAVVMLGTGKSNKIQRAREAFRRLRSSVQFLSASNEQTSFVVTSARPGEGKSVTITNLAVATAQGGSDVVLVSADMRRPMVEKLLSLPNPENGLSSYLGGSDRSDIALRVDGAPNLTVVPSGPIPANPGELLASKRFGEFIDTLKGQFDYVFIDAPPVLSTADSMSAAVHTDGVIVVVDSQHTDTDELLRVSSEIRRAGGTVAGAVLNKDKSDGGGGIFSRDRYAYERVSART